jgi:hypothetical protein
MMHDLTLVSHLDWNGINSGCRERWGLSPTFFSDHSLDTSLSKKQFRSLFQRALLFLIIGEFPPT